MRYEGLRFDYDMGWCLGLGLVHRGGRVGWLGLGLVKGRTWASDRACPKAGAGAVAGN